MNQDRTQSLLNQVHEGMTVYDVEKHKLGTVSDLYFGAAADDPTASQGDPAANTRLEGINHPPDVPIGTNAPLMGANMLATGDSAWRGTLPVFDFEAEVPEQLRSRLLQAGFIKLNGAGILPNARYITPDQIASVQKDAVYLTTTRDQLIKGD